MEDMPTMLGKNIVQHAVLEDLKECVSINGRTHIIAGIGFSIDATGRWLA